MCNVHSMPTEAIQAFVRDILVDNPGIGNFPSSPRLSAVSAVSLPSRH